MISRDIKQNIILFQSGIHESTPKSIFYTQRHEDAKAICQTKSTLHHCVIAYILIIKLIEEDSILVLLNVFIALVVNLLFE